MASNIYTTGLLNLANGNVDYLTDNIAILLTDNTYAFNVAHEYVSDVSASEVSGTGYSRKAISSKTITLTGNVVTFDCGDISYTAMSTSEDLASAIFYKETGTDNTSPLVAHIDFEDISTSNSDINIITSAEGIFQLANILN